jgi:protein O-mannosyl-transferase
VREREAPGRAHYVLVGLLALATYLPSLGNGFTLDDGPVVRDDVRIRDLSSVPTLLAQPYLTGKPAARSPYRPVTTVSYALSWSLGGGSPSWFHATNVALHVGASLLVLALLASLGAHAWAAVLGAAVFAVHPVHVEAVAGVVGRADVLATGFGLAALVLWLSERVALPIRVPGVALLYLLALGAKEVAVVLPALLVAATVLRDRLRTPTAPSDGVTGPSSPEMRPPLGVTSAPSSAVRPPSSVTSATRRPSVAASALSTLPALAGMTVPLALFLLARRAVLGNVVHFDIAAYIAILPTSERVTTAVANLGELLRLMVFPLDLAPEYGPDLLRPAGPDDVRFWGGVAVLLAALGVVAAGIRRPERGGLWLAGGVTWIGIAYALLSNLILPLPMWIAERTLYLASVGVALCVVGVAHGLQADRPWSLRGGMAAALAVVVLAGVHSARHSVLWRDGTTLFTDFAERHPESFRAQWWVGGRFVDAGDVERGLGWLRRAHETNPNSALVALDYARALLLAGRSVEAEAIVRPIPPGLHPSQSVFLAQSLIVQGREPEAADAVRVGLGYFPDDARLLEQARQLGFGG